MKLIKVGLPGFPFVEFDNTVEQVLEYYRNHGYSVEKDGHGYSVEKFVL